MKRPLLFLFCILCLIDCFSQNTLNKIWYFGSYAGIDFNSGTPTALNNSAMYQAEGCASICDNNGQLLFYSNGIRVWNRNHQVMLNGTGLHGDISSAQSALIVPKPSDGNIFYIFTVPNLQGISIPLSYSIVDMTLDGGSGAVTTKNVALYTPSTEKLTGTLKSNGIDYWIIAKEYGTDGFLSFSLTSAGVDPIPVVSHAGLVRVYQDGVGYMKISPNGSKLFAAYDIPSISQLFDFDNNTGLVSNPLDIVRAPAAGYGAYGVEFSPDNSKLYIMQEGEYILRQFDLLAGSPGDIQNSAVEITHVPSQSGFAIALGPDAKIYINNFSTSYLSVIDQPNLPGAACNYIFHAVSLATGTSCYMGLPNNINYPFVTPCAPAVNITGNESICAGQTYQLPSGIIVNTSGIYNDTIRSTSGCDSIITTINLSVFPVSYLNTDVHICPNQTYQLPSGTIVSVGGIYVDTIRSQASCDSVITTTHLFVDDVSLQNADVHICPNQTYQLPSGTIVSVEGIYLDTLRSQASCDSIINTIHLFVDDVSLQNTEAHICPNQTYQLPSGTIVSAEGVYIDTLRSQAFCDSIINTIHLFIDQTTLLNTNASICSNQTYQFPSGVIVSAGGIYLDTLRSQASCDSIINTIHLIVNDLSYTNQVDSIFAGQNYTLPSGIVVSSPGTYQSVLVNSLGCDSVITTTLTLRKTLAECITLKNAITPNGDGINDYWVLYRFLCFKKLEVNVYNRYGSLVYHSDDYKNDWNGKYKGQELPDGTYYYVLKLFAPDGKEHVFRDNLTILR